MALVLACLWLPRHHSGVASRRVSALDWGLPLVTGALTAGALVWAARTNRARPCWWPRWRVRRWRPLRKNGDRLGLRCSLGAMLLAGSWFGAGTRCSIASRTFFGVYRVSLDPTGRHHALAHGTTLHGMQALDRRQSQRALDLLPSHRALRPGAGAAAARRDAANTSRVDRPGRRHAGGVRTARPALDVLRDRSGGRADRERRSAYFTYLDACGASVAWFWATRGCRSPRGAASRYDLIVLDAFSSDAIPVHLLTREALTLYVSRLAPRAGRWPSTFRTFTCRSVRSLRGSRRTTASSRSINGTAGPQAGPRGRPPRTGSILARSGERPGGAEPGHPMGAAGRDERQFPSGPTTSRTSSAC